ncbi:MAG: ribonuclease H, partial [Anaerovoracaceae bacterium]
ELVRPQLSETFFKVLIVQLQKIGHNISVVLPQKYTMQRGKSMTVLKIFTDGGCSGNQSEINFGGWGAILEFGEHKKELYGGEANTTNNRMELTAVIAALKAVNKENQKVEVFTDSSYVANCFREKWYESWRKNGWRNAARKAVENKDLWEELLSLVESHNVNFYRVKGHINLNSKSTKFDQLYEKFQQWNGSNFTYEEFLYVCEMNNRADELANIGITEIKGKE